ncbi:hypothetical protein PMAYCL1PPCAC_31418, partial [Pristionchus mayeri]
CSWHRSSHEISKREQHGGNRRRLSISDNCQEGDNCVDARECSLLPIGVLAQLRGEVLEEPLKTGGVEGQSRRVVVIEGGVGRKSGTQPLDVLLVHHHLQWDGG